MRSECVCVYVCKYSHDSTLGKGEVLHQNVETSVLIIEELPDPPMTQGNRGVSRAPNQEHTLIIQAWSLPINRREEKSENREKKLMQTLNKKEN